jgi:hypothetical protein
MALIRSLIYKLTPSYVICFSVSHNIILSYALGSQSDHLTSSLHLTFWENVSFPLGVEIPTADNSHITMYLFLKEVQNFFMCNSHCSGLVKRHEFHSNKIWMVTSETLWVQLVAFPCPRLSFRTSILISVHNSDPETRRYVLPSWMSLRDDKSGYLKSVESHILQWQWRRYPADSAARGAPYVQNIKFGFGFFRARFRFSNSK